MDRGQPLLRMVLFGVPLLVAGCAPEVGPAAPPSEPCLLLCALTRDLMGEPAPPAAPPSPPVAAAPRPHAAMPQRPPPRPPRPRPARPRLQRPPLLRPTQTPSETSVVPQAPAHPAPPPVAVVAPPSPPPPALSAASPAPAPHVGLTQIIPGATIIMTPAWQSE